MNVAMSELDRVMQRASAALGRMDYPACEADCLGALAMARQREQWAYYARILLPLQEARRQRRIIAAEARVRLGAADLTGPVEEWLTELEAGCIVLTHPHRRDDARRLARAARDRRRCVEVLYADNEASAEVWQLRSYAGCDVGCQRAAPPESCVNRWIDRPAATGDGGEADKDDEGVKIGRKAVDWFLDGAEALGDAALRSVDEQMPPRPRLAALEACLEVVTDHEILHQRLGEAARAIR